MLLVSSSVFNIYSEYLYRDCSLFISTAVGDTVAEDEVVCEIETDKVKLSSCNTLSYSLHLCLMTYYLFMLEKDYCLTT